MSGYARPDIEYAGRVLPGDWTEASGGRVYARYVKDGEGVIRLLAGKDAAGWRFKAERCASADDPQWTPLCGSEAAFRDAGKAQAAADGLLEQLLRARMTAKRSDWR